MSFTPSPQPIQPLSIGNVVSAGLRLYGSHIRSYLKLAFIAYAWILIPIYGWAKCGATLAVISRLAYSELVEQPESVSEASRVVNTRLWQFFVMGLLMLLLVLGVTIGLIIVSFILALIAGLILSGLFPNVTDSSILNPVVALLVGLLVLVYFVLIFAAILWIQARFIVVEVPLAIEDYVDGASTIGRSWDLTKGSVWRIAAIAFIAYLITIPLQLPFSILSFIIQMFLQPLAQENTSFLLLLTLANLVLTLTSAAIVVPFWQTIKAVLYYDLRSRREGFGLKLRHRP
ncbi:MAG: DUF975 domain-containing protein [Calothrix sp. C42_A2020_038]|nr:DUF975 domain-containing protein [Calothrix sp. C42_A2020_038]